MDVDQYSGAVGWVRGRRDAHLYQGLLTCSFESACLCFKFFIEVSAQLQKLCTSIFLVLHTNYAGRSCFTCRFDWGTSLKQVVYRAEERRILSAMEMCGVREISQQCAPPSRTETRKCIVRTFEGSWSKETLPKNRQEEDGGPAQEVSKVNLENLRYFFAGF